MGTQLDKKNKVEIDSKSLSDPKILIDNDTTRITFHQIRPGQQSGWHRHQYDYVGYHFQSSDVRVELVDGSTGSIKSDAEKATFYSVGDGLEHNVTVVGDSDLIALEIEFKK
ncbi:MAG: hypothetical protein VX617_07155 [Pseudomonadota bacterium]|nr:hypothetical protein [Pseudomonadota bacterium]